MNTTQDLQPEPYFSTLQAGTRVSLNALCLSGMEMFWISVDPKEKKMHL